MDNRLEFNNVVKIKVFGIGGAGCNAVNRMVSEGVKGVEFVICNTDVQQLNVSECKNKIILGRTTTKGLGAGSNPEVGQAAALESEAEIKAAMEGADMVFVTAGMGGGTGTGAAPVFARIASEMGALTVAVVTKPFTYEGRKRTENALTGIENLKQHTDSIIIVSNNNLNELVGNIPLKDAFREADNVLRQGVQTITDLIAIKGDINLDFADIKTVMKGKGTALIGIGMASGENKAREAAAKAIKSPLLEAQINGCKSAIINVTGGKDLTIMDSQIANDYIREAAGNDIDTIYGVVQNDEIGDNIIVTIIATGFELPNTNKTVFTNSNVTFNTINEQVVEEKEEEKVPSFLKFR